MVRTMAMAVALMLASALAQADQCSSGGECSSDDKAKNTMSLIQTNLQMNLLKTLVGKATGAHTVSHSQSTGGQIKLIVNSDVRYSFAVKKLFESMEKVSFHRWNDVVVMRGSASSDSDPFTPETKYGKLGVTYVDLKLSSFDLHGFSGLYHHRHDPRVRAPVYFYIHDTVLVDRKFPRIFDSMASTEEFEARHPPLPSKNHCVFGSGVVDLYGPWYDAPRSKEDGVLIEFGIPPFRNPVMFALKQTLLKKGHDGEEVDLYHTGHPRTAMYFPDFGLTKYSLLSNSGDLTGHVEPIDLKLR